MGMDQTLWVDGKRSKTIRVKMNPLSDFRGVIHAFDSIRLPRTAIDPENLKFAILELINNSLRAHKERGEERDILVDITIADGRLHLAIRDYGGGFDPSLLPYPLDSDPAALDIHTQAFHQYQEKNGYKRFGMGIYLAKKTFEQFQLIFLDERDIPVSWAPGRIVGTLIRANLSVREDLDGK
jgi:anti-sigma regulatory factor (Ser/Thr protein kinase)